jgi:hypothetical protein
MIAELLQPAWPAYLSNTTAALLRLQLLDSHASLLDSHASLRLSQASSPTMMHLQQRDQLAELAILHQLSDIAMAQGTLAPSPFWTGEASRRMDEPLPLTSVTSQNVSTNMIATTFQGSRTTASLSALYSSVSAQPSQLPPCDEQVEPHFLRQCFVLALDEDCNWLSECHCFVRSELIEVFRASSEQVKARKNSIAYLQIGLRCRFCAHRPPMARAGRSSAFPSSIRQIYQSITMMLRDHFSKCGDMPISVQEKFNALKANASQGAFDSKGYWLYSATKIGLKDTPTGIMIDEESLVAGRDAQPYCIDPGQPFTDDSFSSLLLVEPSEQHAVPELLLLLLSQLQMVRLRDDERIGNRRSLPDGHVGLGCRFCCAKRRLGLSFCCAKRRLGLSRVFPARRRNLPSKLTECLEHLRRCTLCPRSIKLALEQSQQQQAVRAVKDQGDVKEMLDRLWTRLGHGQQASMEASQSSTTKSTNA